MDRTTATSCTRLARAAALVAVLGWAWMAPSPAAAQVGGLIVTITSPTSGSTVGGTINVTASVSPLGALVAGVQFQLDGANLGAEDTSAPYSVPWNTFPVSNGSHTLVAVARDSLGMRYSSDPVTVTVFNDHTPPTVSISSPLAGATVSATITVTANATDNVGVVGVQFQLDGAALGAEDTTAPYATTWNTTTAADGPHSLSAVARDAAGNTALAASVSVNVSNDTTSPAVSITSPSGGATLQGSVTVTATASDNLGVAGVQFKVDGASIGAEVTTAPYSVTWDTTTASSATHTLTAVARDSSNNSTTSAAVLVNVANVPRKGDLFVSMMDGTVQWWSPDGLRLGGLATISDGQVSSVNWDANQNIYVPHWWSKTPYAPGNTVTRFDKNNHFLGVFGSGYDGAPSSITFDANGDVYVGQADDTGDILKFDSSGNLLANYDVAIGYRGSDHIELAPDGCTMFYTSRTKDIFRYDVCTRTQLPNFNVQPLPGEYAFHLRLLPDGGLVVADGYIYRLDAAGNQTVGFWAPDDLPNNFGGVDLVGDGTFWATNDISGKVHRFDLNSGSIVPIASVSTGVPRGYACGVGVHP